MIEVIIALIVVGIAVTGLLAAIAAASTLSDNHRQDTRADVLLRSYAEVVKGLPYQAGPLAASTYQTAAALPGNGYTPVVGFSAQVVAVRCWRQGDTSATAFGNCNGGNDDGLQRVDLRLGYSGSAQVLSIFKRQP